PNLRRTPRRGDEPPSQLDRQRIDKWLWHARVVRTRAAAAALAGSGHVRLNGQRVDAASRAVKAGDVVTIALDRGVRVLKIVGFAERRGGGGSAPAPFRGFSLRGGPPPPGAPPPRPGARP